MGNYDQMAAAVSELSGGKNVVGNYKKWRHKWQ